jgi:hypothetical protein
LGVSVTSRVGLDVLVGGTVGLGVLVGIRVGLDTGAEVGISAIATGVTVEVGRATVGVGGASAQLAKARTTAIANPRRIDCRN